MHASLRLALDGAIARLGDTTLQTDRIVRALAAIPSR
jgi:hypothetical protein